MRDPLPPASERSKRAAPPPAGTLVDGKWVTEEVLGRGAMGVVVGAHHHQLGQQVAIKFLTSRDALTRARFFQEAKIIASLRSEHVVRVIDVGTIRLSDGADAQAAHADPEVAYIVMERLAGEPLSTYAQRRGPLPAAEAAEIVHQALLAMIEAHALGVVHRDLKPANLFVTPRDGGAPRIRVLDFGVSKLAGEDDNELTATASILGSPAYMAPEQVKSSKHVDARCDLWALGVILHRLLTGELPFSGSTAMAMAASVMADEPAPIDPVRVPPGLIAVVARALQKDPQARPRDAREMAEALAPFAGHADATAGPGTDRAPSGDANHAGSAGSNRAPPQHVLDESVGGNVVPVAPPRARRSAWLVLAAVAVAAVGAAALYQHEAKRSAERAAAAASSSAHASGANGSSEGALGAAGTLRARVERDDPFVVLGGTSLQRTEVTRELFAAYVSALPERDRPAARPLRDWSGEPVDEATAKRPVTWVSFVRAQRFCAAIGARLPRADELERAVGGPDRYPWGDAWPPPRPADVAVGQGEQATPIDVATSPADRTAEGIFDLFGNVAEWSAPATGGLATARGASIDLAAQDAKAVWKSGVQRIADEPSDPRAHPEELADAMLGFRCARGS
jgi:serine/threonine-protein kinase